MEPAAGMALDLPDRVQVAVGEDGLIHLDPALSGRVIEIEEIRPRSHDRNERGHQVLPDRVDGRIRDLGEVLPEVVRERLRVGREHRHGVVRAHRPDRFLPVFGHRGHEELDVLAGVAERLLALEQGFVRRGLREAVGRQVLEPDLGLVEPPLPGTRRGELGLELRVVDDPPLPEVHEQHPARLEPPLAHDPGFGNGERADLGGEDQAVVVRHHVAGGPESVPVEGRPDPAPVGERDRGRTVPRLHDRGVILVERPPRIVHQRVVLPRLGDHQHHGVRQRVASRDQQLQGVVERRGVRDAVLDDGPQLVEVAPEERRPHGVAARIHPVDVAAHGVDLAVVAEVAERVRELPGRKRVGRETLVDHREGGGDPLVREVRVVAVEPLGQDHSLVADGPAGERDDVEGLSRGEPEALYGGHRDLADHEELALERILVPAARAAGDERLPDPGLVRLDALPEDRGVHRYVPPAEEALALGRHGGGERFLAGAPRRAAAGQEHHPDPVAARSGKLDPEPGALAPQQGVGGLDKDAGPVAGERVRADRPPVGDVAEELEPLPDDFAAGPVADVHDEADAARVVLLGGIVESLRGR